jgi:hypothetical protein
MTRQQLHDIITDALEFGVYDHGDAMAIVTAAFESVTDILLKHPRFAGASRLEIELLLYDTQRKAEKALDGYSLIIPNVDADVIVEALLDAEMEPA